MTRKKIGALASASRGMLLGLLGATWLAACGGAELSAEDASLAQQEQELVTLPILINVGGGAFTDTYGRLWKADTGYSAGSRVFQTTEPIAGTENDGLYQSMRIGNSDISYNIPVPGPGVYTVQFLLIEPEKNLPSPRNMYVEAEGGTVLDQYRGLVTPLRSYTVYFDVTVKDSVLSLLLQANPGSPPPVVSAIEVTQSKWSWIGGGPLDATSPEVTGRPSLVVDNANRSVVAWQGASAPSASPNVFVSRWTGSAYQRLGGELGDTWATRPVVMVDASGAPVVSFVQNLPSPTGVCVRVRRWNGTAWTDVGGLVGLPGYEAQAVASAFDTQGQPVIAVVLYNNYAQDARVHVYRFNGMAWEQVGDAVSALSNAPSDVLSGYPSIAVDASGRIVVAWDEDYGRLESAGASYIHVFRRSNGQWVRVGTQLPSSTATPSRRPSLALAPDGTLWVAYRKDSAVDVVREQNGAWVSTPSAGLKGWTGTPEGVGAPLLRIDSSGTPLVLVLERMGFIGSGRFLRKWNGTAWTAVDNRVGPFDTSYTYTANLLDVETDMGFALNTAGQPVVAIPEEPPSGATYGYLRLRTSTP